MRNADKLQMDPNAVHSRPKKSNIAAATISKVFMIFLGHVVALSAGKGHSQCT